MFGNVISDSLLDAVNRCVSGQNQSDSCKRVDEATLSTQAANEKRFQDAVKKVRSLSGAEIIFSGGGTIILKTKTTTIFGSELDRIAKITKTTLNDVSLGKNGKLDIRFFK